MDRRVLALAALGWGIAACSDSLSPSSDSPAAEPVADAGLSAAVGRGPDVRGRFIVTLAPKVNPGALAREHGVQPDFVYEHALNGFAGRISDAARAGLLRDNRVVRVEGDGIATASTTLTGATWGLDRVDQRRLPLSTSFTYFSTGSGVTAYIIDTGLRLSHAEFAGRAVKGYDAVTSGGTAADCNGHGTHVGGTVGGKTYGVAKGVSLVAVRVLDCYGEGTWSGVIAGMDWVTAHHAAGAPAVANLSLGGGPNSSVDDAVRRMIGDGITVAIAAGNGDASGIAQNACNYSPARVAAAITIGATNRYDARASWSNYGSCVDWFAPGVSIKSAWYTGDIATFTISGTSMATPHTAGVAALYLQTHRSATPSAVRNALYTASTKAVVTNSKSTNNHLLFTSY
jgi:subtilisin family serine protease